MSVRWTEDDLAAYQRRRGVEAPRVDADTSTPPFLPPLARARPDDALGRLPAGKMNKTETAYAQHLAALQAGGAVAWFKFEAITLRLANGVRYTPDFPVRLADGELQFHEVKGHWRDKARVKIKVAAELFPFRFIAVKKIAAKNGRGWEREEF